MTLAEQRIHDMIDSGKITAEEGARLLDALRRPWTWRVLYAPLDVLSTRTALLVGLLITVLGVGVGLAGIRFDGALDTHIAGHVTARVALADAVIALGSMTLVMWVAGLVVARKGRAIDHLAAVALARAPNVLCGALLLLVGHAFSAQLAAMMHNPFDPKAAVFGLMIAVVTLPFIVWFFVLLYQGYKTASGLKGAALVVSFIVAVIVAEVLSKIVLVRLA